MQDKKLEKFYYDAIITDSVIVKKISRNTIKLR